MIEYLQRYFLQVLPGLILQFLHEAQRAIYGIPVGIFLFLLAVLAIGTLWSMKTWWKTMKSERRRKRFIQKMSGSASLQDTVHIMHEYFAAIDPYIKSFGIYTKDPSGFRLMEAEEFRKPGPDAKGGDDLHLGGDAEGEGLAMDKYIVAKAGHERRGRFHIYTFIPESKASAIRVVAYNPIDVEAIRTEFYYLAALIENFARAEEAKASLVKAKLMEESRSIFSTSMFNKETYFQFIGHIILKAYGFDTVRLLFKDRDVVLGNPEGKAGSGKLLYVRNTEIKVEIIRLSGVTPEDMSKAGRFLDMISAIMAMYSSTVHIENFLELLETAIRVFEAEDPFYANHAAKVETISLAIGRNMEWRGEMLDILRYAGRFHDIGMMGAIYELTSQEISLSDREYARIKYHPIIGYTIAVPLDNVYPVSEAIFQHHEFLDGTGYPNGISGEKLRMEARILAFSEIFIGLLSDRPHRKGRSFTDAVKEIATFVPEKLDENVWKAFQAEREVIRKDLQALIPDREI